MKRTICIAGALLLAACDFGPSLSPEARTDLLSEITGRLGGVTRTVEEPGKVTAYRWDIADIELGPDRWSWRETEVVAENQASGPAALTTVLTYNVDPAALSEEVPARLTKGFWGLRLACAEGPCIEVSGKQIRTENGAAQEESVPERLAAAHEWPFEAFENRDAAIEALKLWLESRPDD